MCAIGDGNVAVTTYTVQKTDPTITILAGVGKQPSIPTDAAEQEKTDGNDAGGASDDDESDDGNTDDEPASARSKTRQKGRALLGPAKGQLDEMTDRSVSLCCLRAAV